jgi:hypothetical protein
MIFVVEPGDEQSALDNTPMTSSASTTSCSWKTFCRTVGCGGCRYRVLRRVCIVVLFSTIAQLISRSGSDTISNTV